MEEINIKSKETEEKLPDYIKMYEVSGQDTITEHSLNRYIKNKEQDIAIKKEADFYDSFYEKIKEAEAETEEIFSLVKFGLESSNLEVQKKAVRRIESVVTKEKPVLIKLGLESQNPKIQKISARMIDSLPVEKREPLKKIMLEKNIDIKKKFVDISVSNKKQYQEIEKINDVNLFSEDFIMPPLYENKDINDESFSRYKFNKSGSGTTLVGGELKDKTIIRHITPKAFLSWQKIYENYSIWKTSDFDYVPIEQIQSYKLNKNGLVDVYSGVLDLNLGSWINKTDIFKKELEEQREKIIEVLRKLKIEHGHPHEENFCLRFFRDENGKVDFNKTPRLYLIDFDQ
ncbi:MAG: hypothetical protein NTZ44_02825, partial [Candidatus Nomurabacteria bacterium]|nr:hypothetical protein [Candidatus Nomurabacteria bacterium]